MADDQGKGAGKQALAPGVLAARAAEQRERDAAAFAEREWWWCLRLVWAAVSTFRSEASFAASFAAATSFRRAFFCEFVSFPLNAACS